MGGIYKSEAGEQAVKARYGAFLDLWPVEGAERLRVPTSQGETFVVACGPKDAPALVLLHGTASNSAMWLGDVAAWAERFRVYAVDVIGEPGFSSPNRPTLASGAYLTWLDEVLAGLAVARAAFVGISLGGWLALHYATERPDRATAVVVLAPAGVGRHRNVLLWAAPLLLLGPWGIRMVVARVGGATPAGASPEGRAFGEFMSLIFANFRPRTERLPRFSDAALRRLTMPLMAVLGAKDAFIDSAGTRDRLRAGVPHAELTWLPDAGHFLVGHTAAIGEFLRRALGR